MATRSNDTQSKSPPPPVQSADGFTLRLGQIVPLPLAPDGVGQVAEFLRSNVVVLYARSGRLCRTKVSAAELSRLFQRQPLLPGLTDNLFDRGVLPRSKTFQVH